MPTHAHSPGAAAPLTVRRMRAKDAEQVTRVWHGAWLDAYVRPGGVPAQWVDTYWEDRLTPRGVARLAERAERSGRAGITGGGGRELSYLVAEAAGQVVAIAVAESPQTGGQYLHALYVEAGSRRLGAGTALLGAVLESMDPSRPVELGVAAFNDGARRFYRRHGFHEVPGSQRLYEGVLPEITMRREARCGLSHESEGRG